MSKTITARVVRRARERGLTVLTHKQWGSTMTGLYAERRKDTADGRWGQFTLLADTVAQHITVTTPSGDFARDCRTVEGIGYSRFKSGVSYNWLVDMTRGLVAVGQPLDAKGTHTVNDKGIGGYSYDQNMKARAIAVIGQPTTPLSRSAERAIELLLASMVEEGAITRGFDYVPHSLFAEKDCPCDHTRDRMPVMRRRCEALLVGAEKVWVPKNPGPR